MIVPSLVICLGTAILLPLSALLIFGWGPVPGFGVAGGGMAVVLYHALGCAALFAYFAAGRPVLRPRFSRLQWRYTGDMLRVGGIGALNTLQTNGTTAVPTALSAAFGAAGIAGYGVSSRIGYVVIPVGFGAPLVAIVGTNLGAGEVERAYRAAWFGASLEAVSFLVAIRVILFGGINIAAVWARTWTRAAARRR